MADVEVTLADGTGERLLRFAVEDADTVSAIIFGALYRRGGEWKFRAVGLGYDSGLAGLATVFGVDIEDDAEDGEGTPDDERDTARNAPAGQVTAPRRIHPVPDGGGPAIVRARHTRCGEEREEDFRALSRDMLERRRPLADRRTP